MTVGHDREALQGFYSALPKTYPRDVLGELDLTPGDYIFQVSGTASFKSAVDKGACYKFHFMVLDLVDGNENSLKPGDCTSTVLKPSMKNTKFWTRVMLGIMHWGAGIESGEYSQIVGDETGESFFELMETQRLSGCLIRGRVDEPFVNKDTGRAYHDVQVVRVKVDPKTLSKEAKRYML